MSVRGNRPERPQRALGRSYYTEWVRIAKEVGGFPCVSATHRGTGKRGARENGAAHDRKKTAAQRLSTTPRITCRRKRGKPAVAGQVHADVMRHSGRGRMRNQPDASVDTGLFSQYFATMGCLLRARITSSMPAKRYGASVLDPWISLSRAQVSHSNGDGKSILLYGARSDARRPFSRR